MKMAVIGCGLIGGSMALSWKRAGIVDEVIAFGHNPATLQKALDKGAADTVTTSMEEAVKDADIVVSAVPVEAMESVFTEMAPFLKSDAVVTDVGSTRQTVIAAARKGLGDKFHQYAPAHPIAGGEMPRAWIMRLPIFLTKKSSSRRRMKEWIRRSLPSSKRRGVRPAHACRL